ncbi:MAG: DUF2807 domain-containing protein [Bacteroidetes bacterium]|nr:MAG: DUF2807 domain-containing protein [Bacteroidota bacterium]
MQKSGDIGRLQPPVAGSVLLGNSPPHHTVPPPPPRPLLERGAIGKGSVSENLRDREVGFRRVCGLHSIIKIQNFMKRIQGIVILGVLLFTSVGLSAQKWKSGIEGEGKKVTKTLDLPPIHSVHLNVSGDVLLSQGSAQEVRVEAQANIIENLRTEVQDGVWEIKFKKSVRNYDGLVIHITVPTLKEVAISGSGEVKSRTPFKGLDDLRLTISGSGDLEMEVEARRLRATISGSGDMDLAGSATEAEMEISGSGDISAYDLRTEACRVNLVGAGNCRVWAEQELNATLSGAGDISYKGSPRVKSQISGAGDVVARN